MTKYMVLLCAMLTGSACAQKQQPVCNGRQETLYPYRGKSGMFGYADENLQIKIIPQYKRASRFTKQGFAVVTDSLDKKGIIDQNNKVVIAPRYDAIQLHTLDNFTLAEVVITYYARWRFWEWRFLPGLNLMGGGNDSRLFDTKVRRLKKTVFLLVGRPLKICSERHSNNNYSVDKHFNIRTLDSNQVLIDGRLYNVDSKGAHFLSGGIKELLTSGSFAQMKGQRLYITDRKGKKVSKKGYTLIDSIAFKVEDVPIGKLLTREFAPIASAYQSDDGLIYIYPDFSKSLPRLIHEPIHSEDPSAEKIIQGLWTLAPVPESDYFMFMSYLNGESFFKFLDTQGNWHQTLPRGILFTANQRSGGILWPAKQHYISPNEIPEGWKIDRISPLYDSSLYHITLGQDKKVRQGIWNFEQQQWLIAPKYYEVYPMDNTRQWRYHSDHDGLWGVMDYHGKVLIGPTFNFLQPDGWVSRPENGENITFYLHPQTLKEFREK